MASSPEFLRLAVSSSRTLAESALDAGREAVVVIDLRLKHFPVVLANAAARRSILGKADGDSLVDTSLYTVLGAAADSAVESMLGSERSGVTCIERSLAWRLPRGATALKTELKLLTPDAVGQRLMMLTFAEPATAAQVLSAIEQLPLDLLIFNRDLEVTYANVNAARTAGLDLAALMGREASTLLPTSAISADAFRRALSDERFQSDLVEVAGAGAVLRRFQVDIQPLKDESGIAGVAVVSAEVTERRAPRRALATSERRLRTLTEHAHDIITVAGRDGELKYVSGGVKNSLGYTAVERGANSIFEHVHPDDALVLHARYQQLIAGEIAPFSYQYRIRHKDGSVRWLESSYSPALDNPLIRGVVINSRDITERKLAELHLAQREEIFRLAADAVDGVIFEWDLIRGSVDRSRGVLEVLGIDPQDLPPVMEAWHERIHPRDFPALESSVQQALGAARGWTATYRILDGRGRYRSMLERALIQRNAVGDAVRAIGCAVDVSEIKRLTDLLAETQRSAQMGGWEYSFATRELTWTDEMFRIYETTPEEFPVSFAAMRARTTPDSRRRFDDACRRAEATHGGIDLELEIFTLADRKLWVRMIGHLEQLDGRPFRAFGSVQDIQAQKLSQMALEDSTGWLKLSMNMALMHAWRWNMGTDTLQYAVVEGQDARLPVVFPALRKLMKRMPRQDRSAVRRAIETSFTERSELRQEFRLKLKIGGYRSYAAVARPLYDADGKPTGLVGVTQDITERREAENRVRRSEEVLRTTTANTADTLLLLDPELRIRFVNRAMAEFPLDGLIGREFAAVIPESARARVLGKLRHVLRFGEEATYEYEVPRPGGDTQFFESCAVLVRDGAVSTGLSITVRNITERKRMEQEILDVASRERHSIGRDLHDGLGQELTGVALMLRGLAREIEKDAPRAVASVNEIVGYVNQSIETARSLARGLLPVRSDSGGLQLALRTLAARSRDAYGLDVNFRSEVWPTLTFSETNASHLYRIAQEALTNAARHGNASHVDIFLLVAKTTFLLRITDDGVGLPDAAYSAPGMGLRIMRYRAGMIGAKFEIARNEPRGTVIRVIGEEPRMMSSLESAHAI